MNRVNHSEAHAIINKLLKELRIIDYSGYKVEKTPTGQRLHLNPDFLDDNGSGESSGTFPCKVISGSNAAGYTVEIYANGKNEAATGTGTLEVLELLWGDNVPPGTWLIGHASSVTITGGNES